MDIATIHSQLSTAALCVDLFWVAWLSRGRPIPDAGRVDLLRLSFTLSGLTIFGCLTIYRVIDGPDGSFESYMHGGIYILLALINLAGLSLAVIETSANAIDDRVFAKFAWSAIALVTADFLRVTHQSYRHLFFRAVTHGYAGSAIVGCLPWGLLLMRLDRWIEPRRRHDLPLMLIGVSLVRLACFYLPLRQRGATLPFIAAELWIKTMVWFQVSNGPPGPPATRRILPLEGNGRVVAVITQARRILAIAAGVAGKTCRRVAAIGRQDRTVGFRRRIARHDQARSDEPG